MIVASPMFPASTVLYEVNSVLSDLYPDLYAIGVYEPTDPDTGEAIGYDWPFRLPVEATGVINVEAKGSDGGWQRVDRWRWEPDADNQLEVAVPRQTVVRVTYAREPGKFSTDDPVPSLDWASTTFLPDRVADLVALGVAARLAPYMDLGRLTATGIEPRVDPARQVGVGGNLSKQLMQMFQQGVAREVMALQREHPVRLHKER